MDSVVDAKDREALMASRMEVLAREALIASRMEVLARDREPLIAELAKFLPAPSTKSEEQRDAFWLSLILVAFGARTAYYADDIAQAQQDAELRTAGPLTVKYVTSKLTCLMPTRESVYINPQIIDKSMLEAYTKKPSPLLLGQILGYYTPHNKVKSRLVVPKTTYQIEFRRHQLFVFVDDDAKVKPELWTRLKADANQYKQLFGSLKISGKTVVSTTYYEPI